MGLGYWGGAMTKRKHPPTPSLSAQIECLFRKFPILCGVCGERIEWDVDRAWDHHPVEWADGGEHCPSNLRPIHPQPCHRIKSAKAETQRSRIERLEKELAGEPKRKRRKKKIQSRGFPEVSRPFRQRASAWDWRKANRSVER